MNASPAAANSGTSGDGTVLWTTEITGQQTTAGTTLMPFSTETVGAGSHSITDGIGDTYYSQSATFSGFRRADDGVNSGSYLPDGTHVTYDKYVTVSNADSASYLGFQLASPEKYFYGIVLSSSTASTITFYNGSTALLSLNIAANGTYQSASGQYSEYLNVSFTGASAYNKIQVDLPASSNQESDILKATYGTAAAPTQGNSPIPEPTSPGTALLGTLGLATLCGTALRRRGHGPTTAN